MLVVGDIGAAFEPISMGWFMGWFFAGFATLVVGMCVYRGLAIGMGLVARMLAWGTQRSAIVAAANLATTPLRPDLTADMRRFADTTRALIAYLEHAATQASKWRDDILPAASARWLASGREHELRDTIGVSGEVWMWLQTAEALADSEDPQADMLADLASAVREALLRTGPFAPRLVEIMALLVRADDDLRISAGAPYRDRVCAPPRPALRSGDGHHTDEVAPASDQAPAEESRPDAVLHQHLAMMRSVARRYANDHAGREDLLQEIQLAVWQAVDRFRGEASLKTYVTRIAHYRGAWFARRQRSFCPVEDNPDTSPSVHELIDAARRRDRLDDAMQTLPEGQRLALGLLLEGLSYGEIGERLGITERNASVRITRARQALRQRFAGSA